MYKVGIQIFGEAYSYVYISFSMCHRGMKSFWGTMQVVSFWSNVDIEFYKYIYHFSPPLPFLH